MTHRSSGEAIKTTMSENNEVIEASDLRKLSVRDLRQYLRERRAYISGTKAELIQRAIGLNSIGTKTLRELSESDLLDSKKRNAVKFTTPLDEKLPEPWTIKDRWTTDSNMIPSVLETDLYNYLVLNRRRTFDLQSIKAKRQLKAKVFYEDKHVHSIEYCDIDDICSHGYVKCRVIPSLPTGNEKQKPDYNVWVSLSKVTGNIHAAGCTCSAGEGESCNHVAALLYALVDLTKKKKDGLHSVTSSGCKWNMPRKRKLSPRRAEQLVFKKHKYQDAHPEKNISKNVTTKDVIQKKVKPFDTDFFVKQLKQFAPNSAFFMSDSKYLEREPISSEESISNLPALHNINFMYHNKTDLQSDMCKEQFSSYFKSLSVSENDCQEIEEKTRGQSKNLHWGEARQGRITSSIFGVVCKQKESTSPDGVLKTIFQYNEFSAKSVQWGTSHEAAARRVYSKQIQKTHPKLRTFNSGLIVSPKHPHLGCSPDALVKCEHCSVEEGVLEIKCPYKWRYLTPPEACKDKSFYCEMVDNKIQLKKSHGYYYQVQGQMAISGRSWSDFFVWTLRGFSVERIAFDVKLWENMISKLNNFYVQAVIPEMFSHRVKRGLSV